MISDSANESRASLHLKAYDSIRSGILSGELAANQRLVETELAQQLGLSRTPLREGLRLLEREGIVEHIAGKGWVVCPIRHDDIREIFEVKLVLEPYAAARAAELASSEERKAILCIVDRMADAKREEDIDSWLEHDWAFHELLFNCSHNRRLKQTLYNLNNQWMRVRIGVLGMTRRMGESLREHREIAEYIASGDADAASEVTREHLMRVLKSVEEVFQGLPHFKTHGL